ncbi:serine hydrolase [Chiayiivirga flava]|uniref:CubicO group peptidase (Beta-lactamase class C family) n=1 Tax=Chiayiivirga flava TaxID=659595 RepID=A0A7W8D9N8_9GAMM|nr:CubicO group peptidase (beta-lactamase class C family) [Chiayiivirga flava]
MRSVLLGVFVAASSTSFSAIAAPQSAEFAGLARLVQNAKEATSFPSGTAIVAIEGGRVVYEGYFGYADIGARTPVDRDTAFYIASATKPFFALNALLQGERGRIDTATNLQAMFPDLAFQRFDANTVTLRDLLSHTSGIDNPALVWATAYSGLHDAATRRALVAQTTPDPDTAHGVFDYSNVGYNIASVWLDEAIGTPWQTQLHDTIFAPLGMHRTTAFIDKARADGWSIARPYSVMSTDRNMPLYLEKSDRTMHAAGGLVASAPDLARFLLAQMPDSSGRSALPAPVIARSHAQQTITDGVAFEDFERSGYAWGWYIGEYKGKRMLHHFGGFAGFHAHLSFIPESNVALVVLNNEDFLAARLTSLIADYAYGVMLRDADTDRRVAARFDALIEKARGLDAAVARQQETLHGRTWNLSRAADAYAGTYTHALLGDVDITLDASGHPHVRWGRLSATALPFDDKDTMRVELVPNSGSVLRFELDEAGVRSLRFEGLAFARRPQRSANPAAATSAATPDSGRNNVFAASTRAMKS